MNLDNVDFGKADGLVPVIVQDAETLAILMVGYSNRNALEITIKSGKLHFWSRSRNELWLKGERSGNFLLIQSLAVDCDGDAVLAVVRPATGETAICHTGAATCFYRDLADE